MLLRIFFALKLLDDLVIVDFLVVAAREVLRHAWEVKPIVDVIEVIRRTDIMGVGEGVGVWITVVSASPGKYQLVGDVGKQRHGGAGSIRLTSKQTGGFWTLELPHQGEKPDGKTGLRKVPDR